MYNCIVPDANIISNDRLRTLVSAMDHSTILHIYFVAHTDNIYIAANHRIEPYTAIITHHYIACDSSIRSDVTVASHLRFNSIKRYYEWHDLVFLNTTESHELHELLLCVTFVPILINFIKRYY